MAWFKRESAELDTSGEKKVRTEGLWVKCENCRQIIWKKDLEENLNVCPKCDKHFRIDARMRLAQLLDENQYQIFDIDLVSTDPLLVEQEHRLALVRIDHESFLIIPKRLATDSRRQQMRPRLKGTRV